MSSAGMKIRRRSAQLVCLWCDGRIEGLRDRGALGGWWRHLLTGTEACWDGVTIAEPAGVEA